MLFLVNGVLFDVCYVRSVGCACMFSNSMNNMLFDVLLLDGLFRLCNTKAYARMFLFL